MQPFFVLCWAIHLHCLRSGKWAESKVRMSLSFLTCCMIFMLTNEGPKTFPSHLSSLRWPPCRPAQDNSATILESLLQTGAECEPPQNSLEWWHGSQKGTHGSTQCKNISILLLPFFFSLGIRQYPQPICSSLSTDTFSAFSFCSQFYLCPHQPPPFQSQGCVGPQVSWLWTWLAVWPCFWLFWYFLPCN